jgi:hypothetical protein
MRLTVDKTRSVFERYNIVSDGDLDAAAVRLNGLIEPSAKIETSRPFCGDCCAASRKPKIKTLSELGLELPPGFESGMQVLKAP